MEILSNLLLPFTQPMLLFFLGIGTFAGIYIGAIPGLSVTMAVSLLISFTFSWDPLPAIALMIGINVGGVYGGSRSAILLNIPGAPAAVATTFDGYPMAK
ncbi:MAG: tripartite tricarboxylate transporter permease, partial [Clostridium sp.]|nr:tripartite tricarboxylate transporter permease [Clostridium sp.]